MAELKRNFTSSRMNKDLDERLVPNGEYRDALNISISTSESSDEGSVESIKGNSRISTLGISGQKCIGTARDEETNKIDIIEGIGGFMGYPKERKWKGFRIACYSIFAGSILRSGRFR